MHSAFVHVAKGDSDLLLLPKEIFIKQTLNVSVHGVAYTRWGKSTCRSGVNRVYAGRTGSYRY